jgi:glycosyltransferase 2 family protein
VTVGSVEPAAGRGGTRAWRALLVQLLVLGALIAAAVAWVDLSTVYAQISTLSPAPLVGAIAIGIACRFVMGYKWRHLVHTAGGHLPLSLAVSAYFQSAFSGRLVSIGLGGDLLRAWIVGRSGVPGGIVLGSIAVEKVIALVSNVVLATIGGLYLITHVRDGANDTLLWLIVGGLTACAIGSALLLYAPAHARAAVLLKWLPARVAALGERTSAAVLGYRRAPRALAINVLLAATEQLLQVSKLYVIGRALGIDLPAAEFFAALMVVLFARRAAGYVEGFGLAEGISVIALTLLGIAPETAVALAVTNYAVTTVAVLPGAYLLWGNRPGKRGTSGSTVSHSRGTSDG